MCSEKQKYADRENVDKEELLLFRLAEIFRARPEICTQLWLYLCRDEDEETYAKVEAEMLRFLRVVNLAFFITKKEHSVHSAHSVNPTHSANPVHLPLNRHDGHKEAKHGETENEETEHGEVRCQKIQDLINAGEYDPSIRCVPFLSRDSYDQYILRYQQRDFNEWKRGPKFDWKFPDGKVIKTTCCQLNWYTWGIAFGIFQRLQTYYSVFTFQKLSTPDNDNTKIKRKRKRPTMENVFDTYSHKAYIFHYPVVVPFPPQIIFTSKTLVYEVPEKPTTRNAHWMAVVSSLDQMFS